ncbi:hypothetical protein [Methanobacterium alcaliphilum]|uniref:hypothetical protein n=1 Tax=Methanobacterium alcaliphilum TaxID=392018 RepID=UPI00200A03F4|nr:hypothetical protein [Methanobacterium alcaliphilum]MCK9152249.1 hypothetical protein [Methanobacterium alcaliphilum]
MVIESDIEELKKALKNRDCTIHPQSKVMEIIFHNKEDADWFDDIMEANQKGSAVSCLMTMRPLGKSKTHKFIFNIKDLKKFIEMINTA